MTAPGADAIYTKKMKIRWETFYEKRLAKPASGLQHGHIITSSKTVM